MIIGSQMRDPSRPSRPSLPAGPAGPTGPVHEDSSPKTRTDISRVEKKRIDIWSLNYLRVELPVLAERLLEEELEEELELRVLLDELLEERVADELEAAEVLAERTLLEVREPEAFVPDSLTVLMRVLEDPLLLTRLRTVVSEEELRVLEELLELRVLLEELLVASALRVLVLLEPVVVPVLRVLLLELPVVSALRVLVPVEGAVAVEVLRVLVAASLLRVFVPLDVVVPELRVDVEELVAVVPRVELPVVPALRVLAAVVERVLEEAEALLVEEVTVVVDLSRLERMSRALNVSTVLPELRAISAVRTVKERSGCCWPKSLRLFDLVRRAYSG